MSSRVLAASAVPIAVPADTNENILVPVTVPAGAMGPNGVLRVITLWSFTNNANNKTMRVRLGGIGGTIYLNSVIAAALSSQQQTIIQNRNAEDSQIGAGAAAAAFGTSTAAVVTSAVDTAQSAVLAITGMKASAGDSLVLERYLVEIMRP